MYVLDVFDVAWVNTRRVADNYYQIINHCHVDLYICGNVYTYVEVILMIVGIIFSLIQNRLSLIRLNGIIGRYAVILRKPHEICIEKCLYNRIKF